MDAKEIEKIVNTYKTEIANLKKVLAAIPPLPNDFDPKALPANEQAEFAESEKAIAAAKKELLDLEQKAKAAMAAIAKEGQNLLAKVTKGLAQAIKDYQAAVKASDGLTSQRPKTVVALQNASKTKTPAVIAAAKAELARHMKEVEDAAKKSKDPNTKKQVKTFKDGIAKVEKTLATL